MKRQFEEELMEWKNNGMKKPLMVIGARQIGKTFTIEKFIKENFEEYISFNVEKEKSKFSKEILKEVYQALVEKGYNPINQIVGYILSGDPTYITSHNDARNLIRKIERDELLENMVKNYIGLEE